MDKKDALTILFHGAKLYSDNFVNKNMMICFQNSNNNFDYIETSFLPKHYLHLTGIILNNASVRASFFFRKCCDKKLSLNEFDFKPDGTTEIKLNILCQLMNIRNFSHMIGDYNCSKRNLVTDKLAGTIQICMGFVKDGNYFVPNTALKEDTRDLIGESSRVVAVISKQTKEDKYNKIEYVAKKFDINDIYKSQEIKSIVLIVNT